MSVTKVELQYPIFATLDEWEIQRADVIGRARTFESRRQGFAPTSENNTQKYDPEAQNFKDRMGSLGEMAVSKAFNVYFPGRVNSGAVSVEEFKKIPDIHHWEVRAVRSANHRLIIRPWHRNPDKLDRVYISVCVGMKGLNTPPPRKVHCWVRGYYDARNLTEEIMERYKDNPHDEGEAVFLPYKTLQNCYDLLKDITHPDSRLIHDEWWDDEWDGPGPLSHMHMPPWEDFEPLPRPPGEVIPFPKK